MSRKSGKGRIFQKILLASGLRLSGDSWPAGYGRVVLETVDSTLNEAARRVSELPGPTWIMAHHQTAARGRRGRAWQMPVGNFAATLVLMDGSSPMAAALRSYVAALALYDTCVDITGRTEPFALKWPNDVLLNGGKVAGILLETLHQKQTATGMAIGIGVNLATAPEAAQLEAQALRPVSLSGELGLAVTPEEFLDVLATAYHRHEQQYVTYGFAPIREAWLARATKLGEVITARLPNEDITGVFETIDADGQMILQTASGRRRLAAADIFF